MALGGLSLTALCLFLVGASTFGWLLYPLVGVLALGAGLAIPALTALLSRRASSQRQGTLMGGIQAVLSLALISGPILAGTLFDGLGAPAPYILGGALAVLAVPATAMALRDRSPREAPTAGVPDRKKIAQVRERSPL